MYIIVSVTYISHLKMTNDIRNVNTAKSRLPTGPKARPPKRLGLKAGDEITAADEKPSAPLRFARPPAQRKAENRFTFHVLRDGHNASVMSSLGQSNPQNGYHGRAIEAERVIRAVLCHGGILRSGQRKNRDADIGHERHKEGERKPDVIGGKSRRHR